MPIIKGEVAPAASNDGSSTASSKLPLMLLALKLLKLTKAAKAIKVALFVGTAGIYGAVFGWQFGLMLLAFITIHECGHLWAMRRAGFPVRGFYMIPFVGAMIIPDRSFRSRGEEAFIAAMGPMAGLLISLACAVLYMATGQMIWALAGVVNTVLNGFNLLPINPLDGGRMAKSIVLSSTPKLGNVFHVLSSLGLLALGILMVKAFLNSHGFWLSLARGFNVAVWGTIILGSLLEMSADLKAMQKGQGIPAMAARQNWIATAAYLLLIAGFTASVWMMWDNPTVVEVIQGVLES